MGRKNPGEEPLASEILSVLAKEPGIHKRGLRDGLPVEATSPTFEHHLGRLEDEGRILVREGVEINQTVCFTRDEAHLWADEQVRPLWGRHRTRHVAALVVDQAPATSQELAEALGIDRSTVCHHLRKLQDHGLVEKRRDGHAVLYPPSRRLELWVEKHRQTLRIGEHTERTDD